MMAASDIAAAAASWLIRLEAQTSPEIWDHFQAWLDTDKRHRAAFIRLRTGWTHCDRLKQLRPADGRIDANLFAGLETDRPDSTPEAPLPAAGAAGRSSRGKRRPAFVADRRRLLATAAVATGIAALGMLVWLGATRNGWKNYETAIGASQRIALADGSSVLLNTDTGLRVRLSGERRDVELTHGEALFSVAHDRRRPFYVTAAGTLVRVVGTEFSVRIHSDHTVEVLVAEGRVAVGAPDFGLKLGPPVLTLLAPIVAARESAIVGAGTVAVKHQPAAYVSRKLAWTGGHIAFGGEPLEDAVREFNRYNRRHLVIADPAIRQVQVGGIFEATDPVSFVGALEKSFGVRRMPPLPGDNDTIRLVSSDPRTPPQP